LPNRSTVAGRRRWTARWCPPAPRWPGRSAVAPARLSRAYTWVCVRPASIQNPPGLRSPSPPCRRHLDQRERARTPRSCPDVHHPRLGAWGSAWPNTLSCARGRPRATGDGPSVASHPARRAPARSRRTVPTYACPHRGRNATLLHSRCGARLPRRRASASSAAVLSGEPAMSSASSGPSQPPHRFVHSVVLMVPPRRVRRASRAIAAEDGGDAHVAGEEAPTKRPRHRRRPARVAAVDAGSAEGSWWRQRTCFDTRDPTALHYPPSSCRPLSPAGPRALDRLLARCGRAAPSAQEPVPGSIKTAHQEVAVGDRGFLSRLGRSYRPGPGLSPVRWWDRPLARDPSNPATEPPPGPDGGTPTTGPIITGFRPMCS